MLKVGVICDLREEQWPSMDLVGDMMMQHLAVCAPEKLKPVRVLPAMRRSCTALPLTRNSRLARNADRLLNRALYYPVWLRSRASEFDICHIVDHSYAQLAWQTVPEKTVVTCHDLDAFACLLGPEGQSSAWFRAYSKYILTGLQRAAHVVFVSEAVRQVALARGLVRADKSSVIYNGVDPACSPEADSEADAAVAQMLPSADTPLMLHVGSTVRRKRIDVLLKVFAGVRKSIPGLKLVRVGGKLPAEYKQLAASLDAERDIVELPFLSRRSLAAVYRRCAVTLVTSDAEGFGLPVAEAMACGCPVIATDLPVLREVGGSAVGLAPQQDIAAWVTATVRVLREQLAGKQAAFERRQQSIRNAGRFSWTESAQQLCALYENLSK
jgi:glycosyltransferase involved in cell wall biosynthesis